MATSIYFDESGNTGTALTDPQQPYFTIGSTDIPEMEAVDIIKGCFPQHKGQELKSKDVLKRPQGRRGFLRLANEVGKQPNRFVAATINKRFALFCKMVDYLVEPEAHSSGHDFYQDNYAVKYANTAYFGLRNFLEPEKLDALLNAYNAFARSPEPSGLRSLERLLTETATNASEYAGVFLLQMASGARFLGEGDLTELKDSNDIHVTSVVSSMGHWQNQHSGPFAVYHDESMHFFSRAERWSMMTDPNHPLQILRISDKKILSLPIPVISTTSTNSHVCPSVQLCDLIAGFSSRVKNSSSQTERTFIAEALDAGMGKMGVYPVDAGTEFVSGPPATATGPDFIDRIAMGIAATRRRTHD